MNKKELAGEIAKICIAVEEYRVKLPSKFDNDEIWDIEEELRILMNNLQNEHIKEM